MEEGPDGKTETRVSTQGTRDHYIETADRLRRDKRRGDPDDMDEDINKIRRINSDIAEGDDMSSIPGSPDDQPDTKFRKIDDEMLDSMTEIDRKILAAAILGVEITEVYSPERVAKVEAKFGFRGTQEEIMVQRQG